MNRIENIGMTPEWQRKIGYTPDCHAITLDGSSLVRMASAWIVELWNENGILIGRDENGLTFAFPSAKAREAGPGAGVAQSGRAADL